MRTRAAGALDTRVVISSAEGHRFSVPFEADEITIGRGEENAVRLPDRNISRRHVRMIRGQSGFLLEELSTSSVVALNGAEFHGRGPLVPGDSVRIGDYELVLQCDALSRDFAPWSGVNTPGAVEELHEFLDEEVQPVEDEGAALLFATGGRRLLAYVVDLLPLLVLFRYTYGSVPWAAFLAGVVLSGLSLGLAGGTLGQLLLGIRPRRENGGAAAFRAALQFGLQTSWLLFFGAFVWAAYGAAANAPAFGLASLVALALTGITAIPSFFQGGRTVLDRVMGLVVIRKGV